MAEIHLAKRPKLFRQTEPALQIIYNSPSTGRKYDISFYRLVIDLQHHSMHEERYERYQSTTNHGRCTIAEHADDGSPRPPIWHSPEGKDFDQVGIEY
ncbi:hypothetical protein [Sinorhizobium medicae]|uniref:hypothetical protein n=1 Tax=Sinorhizobium medicae TaxID=110321 RepID=UPI0012F8E974|nr:hypothetical protein [Sinorhizobium medicae]